MIVLHRPVLKWSLSIWLIMVMGIWLATTLSQATAQPTSNKVVYQLDMTDLAVVSLKLPAGGQWTHDGPGGQAALKITIGQTLKPNLNAVSIPIDLTPYRGMILLLTCKAKAQNVTKPHQSWNGIKCMLNFKSPSGGEHWVNQGNVYGSFDWKTLHCTVNIPDDATPGNLLLGMQDCQGTAWISDVKLIAVRSLPQRLQLPADVGPAYKGHDLPRLRGVMSPQQFREADFVTLQQWNVNVVRWQMTRHWGQANTDMDLAEYDKWIDSELADLHKAAASAQKHGIKLVIDLHTPPGGRLPDRTLRMVMEKKYQDHFVKVWQRIATQFKDNPAIWAYDLINEPSQNQLSPDGVADWLGVQILAAKAIRKIDPTTAIAFEVDGWDSPEHFTWLAPVDIPNVIYQVHMYWPGQFTHQGVYNDWGVANGNPKVTYPGTLNGKPLDKAALRRVLQPVRNFQLQCNAHIYVGEFSAIRWAPGAAQYLSDCISIFEEYGWDWTYHAFREWSGWSVEHANLPADRNHAVLAKEMTDREKVLRKWFAQNKRADGQ